MKGNRLVRMAQETDAFRIKLLVVCFLFALGVVCGRLAHGGVTDRDDLYLRNYLLQFAQVSATPQDMAASVLSTLAVYFRYPLLLMLCGCTAAGMLLVPILCMAQGFSLAFAASCFISAMGTDGLLLAVVVFGLRSLIVLPCFFMLAILTLGRSYRAAKRSTSGKAKKTEEGQRSSRSSAVCVLLLLLGSIVEIALGPHMLRLALNMIT